MDFLCCSKETLRIKPKKESMKYDRTHLLNIELQNTLPCLYRRSWCAGKQIKNNRIQHRDSLHHRAVRRVCETCFVILFDLNLTASIFVKVLCTNCVHTHTTTIYTYICKRILALFKLGTSKPNLLPNIRDLF